MLHRFTFKKNLVNYEYVKLILLECISSSLTYIATLMLGPGSFNSLHMLMKSCHKQNARWLNIGMGHWLRDDCEPRLFSSKTWHTFDQVNFIITSMHKLTKNKGSIVTIHSVMVVSPLLFWGKPWHMLIKWMSQSQHQRTNRHSGPYYLSSRSIWWHQWFHPRINEEV